MSTSTMQKPSTTVPSSKPNSQNDTAARTTKQSSKRPRAPIACFRCHHKKVRCDGIHPNCTRCLSTGVLCAYPSSRRSRTTQPTNIDPFIDNLSHLEARIRRIEGDLEDQRSMIHSINSSPNKSNKDFVETLSSKIVKTELEVQDSRSILAQLRLRGEQRISKAKRAAAVMATAAAEESSSSTKEGKTGNKRANTRSCYSRTSALSKNKSRQQQDYKASEANMAPSVRECSSSSSNSNGMMDNVLDEGRYTTSSMLLDSSMRYYEGLPPGHGSDWTLFDQDHNGHLQSSSMISSALMSNPSLLSSTMFSLNEDTQQMMFSDKENEMTSMVMNTTPLSTRSSSLASSFSIPIALQPSNSTNSVASNITILSSTTSCTSLTSGENIFNFNMEDMMLHLNVDEPKVLSDNTQPWY